MILVKDTTSVKYEINWSLAKLITKALEAPSERCHEKRRRYLKGFSHSHVWITTKRENFSCKFYHRNNQNHIEEIVMECIVLIANSRRDIKDVVLSYFDITIEIVQSL